MDKFGSLTGGRPRSIMQLTTDGLHMAIENMGNFSSLSYFYLYDTR
jgi:hypothetical protein